MIAPGFPRVSRGALTTLIVLTACAGPATPPAIAIGPSLAAPTGPSEATASPPAAATSITILHTNDVHSRFYPVRGKGEPPLGGVAQTKTLVDRVREERRGSLVLLFDGGDFAQGTLFYDVWHGSAEIMAKNALGYDALVLGNHQFDEGVASLARSLRGGPLEVLGETRSTEAATMPIVVSNLDVSREPALAGLVVRRAVVERDGIRVGVVGAVTEQLSEISNTGVNLKVEDTVASVQREVDVLTSQGLDKIVMLSHSGTKVDLANAEKLRGIDVIVSGHDHALFGDARALAETGLPQQATRVKATYPVPVKGKDGRTTLVVSASEWGRFVGRLDVTFNAGGEIEDGHWSGGPIAVREDTYPPDPEMVARLAPYARMVERVGSVRIGTAAVPLLANETAESTLGDVAADGMLAVAKSRGAVAAIAEGDFRAGIDEGPVTYEAVYEAMPFRVPIVVVELTGAEVEATLRHGFGLGGSIPQVAGFVLKVRPKGTAFEITSLTLRGKPVGKMARVRIAVDEYLAQGGDGYVVLKQACDRARQGLGFCEKLAMDVTEAIATEIKAHSPVVRKVGERIVKVPWR